MNFYESEVVKAEKRLKKIAESPSGSRLMSNQMLYELERDSSMERLRHWQEGKPLAEFHLLPLTKALGMQPILLEMCADRTQLAPSHFDNIRSMGFPDRACDRTTIAISMVARGELPRPNLMVVANHSCDPIMLAYNALGRMFNSSVFCLDYGLEADEENLRYVTEQLGELIEFAEHKIPGVKFNQSILTEIQEIDRKAFSYLKEIYEFRKCVPSPISGRDSFRIPWPPSFYSNPVKALDYFRVWHDELGERVSKGVGALKEERLRFLWAVSGPFYADPFSSLERLGVSVPWFHYDIASRWSGVGYGFYGDEKEYGRKLSPLEEEARVMCSNSWSGKASRWVGDTLRVCRDLKIDAIINFRQMGCVATVGLSKLLEDSAQRELDIPTLHIEGRQLDPTYFNPAQVQTQLELFVDSCLHSNKNSRIT